jgi:uncharacterized protein
VRPPLSSIARVLDALVLGRGRPFFFAAMAAITVPSAWLALEVRQEQSTASMNSALPEERRAEADFRRDFGGDEVIVVAMSRPDPIGPEGIAVLGELTERIGGLDGVRHATSLANVRQIVAGPDGAEAAPLVPEPRPPVSEFAAVVRRALDANPHLTGLLISADRATAAIVVEVEDRPDDDAYRARLVQALRAMEEEVRPRGVTLYITGITVQKYDTNRLVGHDRRVLLPLAALMLALALAAATRRVAGVALPLLVTGVTVVITVGLYALLGYQVNVITSLLPPLLLVLSTTTAIHLYEDWAEDGAHGADRIARLRGILRFFLAPCFMTSLTSAIGLGSLVTSDIPAVRLFGAFGAFGIMLSFAVNFTLLPAVLSLMKPPAALHRGGGVSIERVLTAAARLAVRRPGTVFLVASVPTVLALAGMPMIRNNTDLLRFLREDEPLVRDTRFIDRSLGGASAIDLVVARVDGRPITGLDDVRRLQAFGDAVRRQPDVTGILGLTDLLVQLNRAEHGLDRLALPDDAEQMAGLFDLLDAAPDQTDIRRVLTADARRTRLSVRLHAIGTRAAAGFLDAVDAAGRSALGPEYRVTPVGEFHKVTIDSNRLVTGQVQSFGTALALVLLVVGALLRSWRLVVAALLPNIVPIVWTIGTMGWLGIDLSTATTMVASVVLGLAVDDAIHYLTRFRSEFAGDLEATIDLTARGTGRVLTITTVTLTLGFWVGVLSSFRPTVHFSLLTGLTMITSQVCTVLLLPACLRVLHADRAAG